MSLTTEDSGPSDLDDIEKYLLKEEFLNIYTLGDLETSDPRVKFRIAKSGREIAGLMMTYEFDDYPIIWLHAVGQAADRLLGEIVHRKFVMITETSSLLSVFAEFRGARAFRESVMHLNRKEFRSYPNDGVRKVKADEVYAWARSLGNDDRPDSILLRKAEEKLKRNDCFGYFVNGDIVSRGVVDTKSKHGWAIGGIYTLPGYRNQGFATSVMSGIVEAAPFQVTDFVLYVRKDNSPAIRSYEKTGFNAIGERVFVDYNVGITP